MKLVVYGSLLNQQSLEKTLGRRVTLYPMQLSGYTRVFNAPFDGYAFANLTSSSDVIDAAYVEMESEELVRFVEREAGSEVIEVAAAAWPSCGPVTCVKI